MKLLLTLILLIITFSGCFSSRFEKQIGLVTSRSTLLNGNGDTKYFITKNFNDTSCSDTLIGSEIVLNNVCSDNYSFECNSVQGIVSIKRWDNSDCTGNYHQTIRKIGQCIYSDSPNSFTEYSCSDEIDVPTSDSIIYFTSSSCSNYKTDFTTISTVPTNYCFHDRVSAAYYTCNSTSIIYNEYHSNSCSGTPIHTLVVPLPSCVQEENDTLTTICV